MEEYSHNFNVFGRPCPDAKAKNNEKIPAIIILPDPDDTGSKSPKDSEMNRKVEPKQSAIINKNRILVGEVVFIFISTI